MTITARPHNNGNTVEDFTEAFYALIKAERAIERAVTKLKENVVHGRNYQHSDRKTEGFKEDIARIAEIGHTRLLINALKLDIVEAVQPVVKGPAPATFPL